MFVFKNFRIQVIFRGDKSTCRDCDWGEAEISVFHWSLWKLRRWKDFILLLTANPMKIQKTSASASLFLKALISQIFTFLLKKRLVVFWNSCSLKFLIKHYTINQKLRKKKKNIIVIQPDHQALETQDVAAKHRQKLPWRPVEAHGRPPLSPVLLEVSSC